jgi:molybdopterin converting factor small subunit
MHIRVVFAGRNYDRTQAVPACLDLPEGSTVDAALEALQASLGGKSLPESCLVAVSGVHLGTLRAHQAHPLRDGDELLLLAPVAGG